MQFVHFARQGSPQWGVKTATGIHSLSADPTGDPTVQDLANPSYRRRVLAGIERDVYPIVDADDVEFLAPVQRPGTIVCVGLNYHDHASEQNLDPPEKPMLFAKAPTAVTDPESPIVYPGDVEQVDYEVELAVVIGREATSVPADRALEYVAGYTVLNDVSARDAQFEDEQFFRAKSYDTFAPMGPTLVTPDDLDPNALDVTLRVNDEVKQRSNTEEFIFDVESLIEYISNVMTLRPGDVISTGTPGGVGIFRDPPDLLEPGDEVEAEIEGVGTLANHVTT